MGQGRGGGVQRGLHADRRRRAGSPGRAHQRPTDCDHGGKPGPQQHAYNEAHGWGLTIPAATARSSGTPLNSTSDRTRAICSPATVEVILGVLLGWAIAASVIAGFRLIRPPRVISNEQRAMQEALHAATATLPHLRRGLSAESASKTVGHLLTLTQARAVALLDADRVLALAGAGVDHHDPSEWMALAAHAGRDDRLHVENRIRCSDPNCPVGSAVLAPLVVREERVGTFLALFSRGWRLTPEETRTVGDAASLVSAAAGPRRVRGAVRAPGPGGTARAARPDLPALRLQRAGRDRRLHPLQPRGGPRAAHRIRRVHALRLPRAQPLRDPRRRARYVEKYLRLERARFGDRLEVRLQVAPEVLPAVRPPCSSLQPLVENAVRHGVERRQARPSGRSSAATSTPTWSCASPTTGLGMDEHAGRGDPRRPTARGVGLMNVQARLRAGLRPRLRPGRSSPRWAAAPR